MDQEVVFRCRLQTKFTETMHTVACGWIDSFYSMAAVIQEVKKTKVDRGETTVAADLFCHC